jgi:hypothetical protein
MLGFKSMATAEVILTGIEMVRMMRKQQARFAYNGQRVGGLHPGVELRGIAALFAWSVRLIRI